MRPVIDNAEIQQCYRLLNPMMRAEPGRTYEFDNEWVQKRGWQVVPSEDTCHFAYTEILAIVGALRSAGYNECLVIASEPVDPSPSCYRLTLSEEDFLEFNAECGPFRFVLTDDTVSWAISCNEWYNLFAGKADLVEALLGKTIARAREEFLVYASLVEQGDPNGPLMRVALNCPIL